MIARAVLFDVDGTLLDTHDNLQRVWRSWSRRYGLDPDTVHEVALRTRPRDTFAVVAAGEDPDGCLAVLHELEDEDAASGDYDAFTGAADLLQSLPPASWALVTSNYEHRVRARFHRTRLPLPGVIVDAEAVRDGKPDPAPYLHAAQLLHTLPAHCLVIEDSVSGARSGHAAGMTVWTVNTTAAPPEATRHYRTLRDAAPGILEFLGGPAVSQ